MCGLAAGLCVGALTGAGAVTCVELAAVAGVGALLPDIDSPRAMITQALGPAGQLVCRAVRALSARMGGPEHRGVTHWWVAAVLVAAVVSPVALAPHVPWWVGVVVGAGMWVHVLGDLPTLAGVPVFGPMKIRGMAWRPIWITPPGLRFRVGSDVDEAPFEAIVLHRIVLPSSVTAAGMWASGTLLPTVGGVSAVVARVRGLA
jgi:membrane-bound metal-dependent hydrolase YbcI (DUF457 family)